MMSQTFYKKSNVENQWLGARSYQDGMDIQNQLIELVQKDEERIFIIGMTLNKPVITLGVRGSIVEDVSLSSETQPEIFRIRRGGQATVHEPGQVIIYPILSLKNSNLSVRRYVELLIQSNSNTIKSFGLNVRGDLCKTGNYILDKKIGFVGVGFRRGVSSHGVSINVTNSMRSFSSIRSCGHSEQRLTSLQKEGKVPIDFDLNHIFKIWSQNFLKTFINK